MAAELAGSRIEGAPGQAVDLTGNGVADIVLPHRPGSPPLSLSQAPQPTELFPLDGAHTRAPPLKPLFWRAIRPLGVVPPSDVAAGPYAASETVWKRSAAVEATPLRLPSP